MKINAKINKRYAFCKYWYDPTNAYISPTNSKNQWEVDTQAKQKCLKINLLKTSTNYCSQYECKIPIVD